MGGAQRFKDEVRSCHAQVQCELINGNIGESSAHLEELGDGRLNGKEATPAASLAGETTPKCLNKGTTSGGEDTLLVTAVVNCAGALAELVDRMPTSDDGSKFSNYM